MKKHSLETIVKNSENYKLCEDCSHINLKENENCIICNGSIFSVDKVEEVANQEIAFIEKEGSEDYLIRV